MAKTMAGYQMDDVLRRAVRKDVPQVIRGAWHADTIQFHQAVKVNRLNDVNFPEFVKKVLLSSRRGSVRR